MSETVAIGVQEASQVGEARRFAVAMARDVGFDETGRGRVALATTELATNLVKHAKEGELVLQAGPFGLEILALDRGPGMADLDRCLADGFSTAGSPGNGLGAIARLGDVFEVHSSAGVGTTILVRFRAWAHPPAGAAAAGLEVGAVSLPMRGEEECGDSWAMAVRGDRVQFLVVDGLGHGHQAAEAARVAIESFRDGVDREPIEVVLAAHEAMRPTRGGVLAVAEVDRRGGCVRFVGIGNIAATVLAGGRRSSMVSHSGTAGHQLRKVQEFTYEWPPDATLVMHSDGLNAHWAIDRYPGLAARDPSLVAGVLYRDFKRGRDDATVVVAREPAGSPIP